jgi:D-alanyl-D-alanine carboxypeptidase
MRRRSAAALFLSALFSGPLLASGRVGPQPAPVAAIPATAWERIDAFVRALLEAEAVPGLALSVVERSGEARTAYYGVADLKTRASLGPETLFEIGSLTKAFTAVLLLQLSEERKVDLSAPVTKALPWFGNPPGGRSLTPHDLLTHSSGLATDREDVPTSLYMTLAARERPLGFAPGSAFHYSNLGYQILGHIAEEVSGLRYAALVRTRIFDRLGMTRSAGAITSDLRPQMATGYVPLWDDRPPFSGEPRAEASWVEYGTGDGCIASTAPDMVRWLRMLLDGGRGPTGRLLSDESFASLVTPAIRITPLNATGYSYGFNVRKVDGRTLLRHTGGMLGYTSAVLLDLDSGIAVLALSNLSGSEYRPTDATDFVYRVLLASRKGEPLPAVPSFDKSRVPNAAEYAGTFVRADGERISLVAEGDKLLLVQGERRYPLEARGEDTFRVDHPDFALHLLRFGRQNGKPVEASYGPSWFTAAGYDGPRTFSVPKEWFGFVGHYRAFHPWTNNFRVFIRKEKLWIAMSDGSERLLVPSEGDRFRMGEERTPERFRFDTLVKGSAQRAVWSGVEFYRFFTP